MLLSRLRSAQLESLFENTMKSNSYVHPRASQFCQTYSAFLCCSCSWKSLDSCNAQLAQLFTIIATYQGQNYKIVDTFYLSPSSSSPCTACITTEAEKYVENMMLGITCFLHSTVLRYHTLSPVPPATIPVLIRSVALHIHVTLSMHSYFDLHVETHNLLFPLQGINFTQF